MAIEIDRVKCTVLRGGVWIGNRRLHSTMVSALEFSSFAAVYHAREKLGRDWDFAFGRDARGWFMDPEFDLGRMLLPRNAVTE